MSDSLNGLSILIIGATGGIGSAATRHFAQQGARLSLFSRNQEKLTHLKGEFPDALIIEGDASSADDLKRAAEETEHAFGAVDVLLHAVGSIVIKALHSTSEEVFRQTLETNLVSPFLAAKAVLPGMISRKKGSVIFCSSVAGSTGLKYHEAIAAAKGGVNALVRSAAVTYAAQGIRFNAVSFGLIDTPLARTITGNERALTASVAMHPMGRIGTPQDVISALSYFASDQSQWTTGQVLEVDGGLGVGK